MTDVIIHPQDGAMYFAVGGRRTQSGLYRVTYVGRNPPPPSAHRYTRFLAERQLRRQLESFHGQADPDGCGNRLALPQIPIARFASQRRLRSNGRILPSGVTAP